MFVKLRYDNRTMKHNGVNAAYQKRQMKKKGHPSRNENVNIRSRSSTQERSSPSSTDVTNAVDVNVNTGADITMIFGQTWKPFGSSKPQRSAITVQTTDGSCMDISMPTSSYTIYTKDCHLDVEFAM